MTAKVRGVLRSSKDLALAFSARIYFNRRFRDIGEITDLSIDTKKRACRLSLLLAGEAEPVDIHVKEYEVQRRGDVTVTVLKAAASRKWLTAALHQFVLGKSFIVPAEAGAVLNLLT